jgi:hypothetical protein
MFFVEARFTVAKGVAMERETWDESDTGFVRFFRTGEAVKGEFHCSECRYGVTICRELPRCPMCGGETWEQTSWSPFHAGTGGAPPRPFDTMAP